MEEGGGRPSVEAARMEGGGAAGGFRALALEAASAQLGCLRAPVTDEAGAPPHPAASTAGHAAAPPPASFNLASYKLTVTYAARSYTSEVGQFTTVSAWTWETCTEKKDSYEQFVRFLHGQWPWSNQEGIVFSWWSCSKKLFVLVLSDDNLVNMFDGNEDEKHIRILVHFCKKGEEDQLVNTLVEPIPPPSPFKKREQQPVVEDLTQNSQQQDECEEEEDHVGIDEEFTMYSDDEEEEDVAANVEEEARQYGPSDVEEDSEEVEVHERSEEDEDDDDDDEEITDEEDSDGAVSEDIPVVHYDKENPSFTKGSLFPSIAEFKVALSTHALKGEFNYKTIKSDSKRVRVKCASGKKCKWRINGYVLADGYTVQVRNEAVDGHSWLYPVAYAVFDSETLENWNWFMDRLKSAIGTPEGLVICTDACKGLETAVHNVFPQAEHRECFRHLIINFRKKFHGEVFEKNMWPAAYTYSPAKYEHHMRAVEEANAAAIEYLKTWHPNLWSRSKFSAACKCDYVMNNIAESFNSMIRKLRGLPVLDLLNTMRQWLMVRWSKRAGIARKFAGKRILPSVTNMMNNRSRGIVLDSLSRSSDSTAEVAVRIHGYSWRHTVDLEKWECSCRRWQISGLPCLHAIAFITSIRGGTDIDHYVHDYYSVQSFSNAYQMRVPTMTDKKQWPEVDVGFHLFPPVLKKASGRPREKRIKAAHESISRKKHKCKQCKEYGHMMKTCPELYPQGKPRNRKRKNVDPDTNLEEDVDITQELAADTHLQQSTQTPKSASSKGSAKSKKKGGGKRAKLTTKSVASCLPPLPQGSPIPARARKGTTVTPDSPASNTRSKISKKRPPATSTRS